MRSIPFLRNLLAGAIVALNLTLDSIAIAVAVFSGNLANHFSFAISNTLLTSTLSNLIIALGSSFVIGISMPSPNGLSIIIPMAAAIAASLAQTGTGGPILPTVWAAIALSTCLTGLFLILLGRLHLSYLIRFIPFPVVTGFLVGTGWFLTRGGIATICGVFPNLANLPRFLEGMTLAHLLPGLLLTLGLLVAERRYKHPLVFPGLILSGFVLAHLVLWGSGTPLERAIADGWFLKPLDPDHLQQLVYVSSLAQVDWAILLQQSGNLVSIALLLAIVVLLNTTGLEIALNRDPKLDREVGMNGIANLVVGLCGGMVSQISPGHTLLNRNTGGSNRLSGIFTALFCGAMLLFGGDLLSHFPWFVVGSLTLYPGLSLLLAGLYDNWFKSSRLDYFLVVLILVVIASFGFLAGIGTGVVIACLMFVLNYSRLNVAKFAQSGVELESDVRRPPHIQRVLQESGDQLYALTLQGYIFFGTANTLLNQVQQRLTEPALPPLRFLLLDFRLVSDLDASAILTFTRLKQLLHPLDCTLILTQLTPLIQQKLEQGHVLDATDESCCVFPTLNAGLEWYESQVLKARKVRRTRFLPFSLQLTNLLEINTGAVHQFIDYLEPLELQAGQFLFHRGDPADGLYFIESGQLVSLLELPEGRSQPQQIFRSGTVVGEMGLFRKAPRAISVVAEQNSTLHHLSTQMFEQLRSQHPALAANLQTVMTNLIAERLEHCENQLRSLLR